MRAHCWWSWYVLGYLSGLCQGWGGLDRCGAKLRYVFHGVTIPCVTVVTPKSYGDAYIAMHPRSLGTNAVHLAGR